MGIGSGNGGGITLLDEVRECTKVGSWNDSLDEGGREEWRKGCAKGRLTLSSLGLEIMSSSASGRGCDSKEVRGFTGG